MSALNGSAAALLPGRTTRGEWGPDAETAGPTRATVFRGRAASREQLQRYSHEYELAAEIQRHLLPTHTPQVSPFDIAALCRPCETLAGDFYDFFPLCGGQGIAVGDVSGKGLPASLLVTSLRAGLRAHANDLRDLGQVIRRLNDDFARDTRSHQFATLFLGVLDPQRMTLSYCSAGHEPALLVRDGQIIRLTEGGMALGIAEGEEYACEVVSLQPGDVVAVFTDGVTEARDPQGRMFGRERVARSLLHARPGGAADVCNNLVTELKWFVGTAPCTDDVTLLTLAVGSGDGHHDDSDRGTRH